MPTYFPRIVFDRQSRIYETLAFLAFVDLPNMVVLVGPQQQTLRDHFTTLRSEYANRSKLYVTLRARIEDIGECYRLLLSL